MFKKNKITTYQFLKEMGVHKDNHYTAWSDKFSGLRAITPTEHKKILEVITKMKLTGELKVAPSKLYIL